MKRIRLGEIAACMLLIVALFGVTGCGGGKTEKTAPKAQSEVINLRLAHAYDEKQPLHQGAMKMAAIVAEKTNGKVQIKLFPNSTLGSPREITEGMKNGTIDMGLIPTTNAAVFYNKLDLFYLPFLFSSKEQAYAVSDGPVGAKLYEEYRQKTGIKTLGMYESGFRQLTNSKKPVRVPADLAGLKIRSTDSPINVDTFKSLGVNTSPMAMGEIFTALQQGTVDGQDNPIGNVYALSFYKVQKYLTLTRHQWAGIMINHVMHREFYDISPKTAQRINNTRVQGGRIIAVGTTAVRSLETAARNGKLSAGSGWSELFIYPGYSFQLVDALITNFHLPQSTLLMLVSALAGREKILAAYQEAVRLQYRFFSFGDAMFIK